MAQVLFFDVFFEKDPHLNVIEFNIHQFINNLQQIISYEDVLGYIFSENKESEEDGVYSKFSDGTTYEKSELFEIKENVLEKFLMMISQYQIF